MCIYIYIFLHGTPLSINWWMSIHNRETNKNGRSFGGVSFIYIPISPSTSFIIVVVTTTIPESSTSRQQPPIPDQSRACFSDSTPTGSYFVFAFSPFSRFRVFCRFRVFAVFAFSRGLPLHHRGPRHTFRMHSKSVRVLRVLLSGRWQ